MNNIKNYYLYMYGLMCIFSWIMCCIGDGGDASIYIVKLRPVLSLSSCMHQQDHGCMDLCHAPIPPSFLTHISYTLIPTSLCLV